MEFRARALKGEARLGHVLTFREFIAAYVDDIATRVSAKTAPSIGARRQITCSPCSAPRTSTRSRRPRSRHSRRS